VGVVVGAGILEEDEVFELPVVRLDVVCLDVVGVVVGAGILEEDEVFKLPVV
jgi:hypothetical protein